MSLFPDKEFLILTKIDANPNATQRDISRDTGLSLGSVNLLLKKMAKEGLIKIESIPAHRVAYMLTPKGMVEKTNKTINYIKRHYNAITQTKETIKGILFQLAEEHPRLYLLNNGDEVSNLAHAALEEMGPAGTNVITSINKVEEALDTQIPIIHCEPDHDLEHLGYANPVVSLLERL